MAIDTFTSCPPNTEGLKTAASLSEEIAQGSLPVVCPRAIELSDSDRAALSAARGLPETAAPSCVQNLWLSFFFDGTGNNLDADIGTREHSNVARLFNAHRDDDDAKGQFRFYIPGIGTYFRQIGDPGWTPRERGFGALGQERIDWALKQFDARIKAAAAKSQPANEIRSINVSVFGFSRGAAQARAFARKLHERCSADGERWKLSAGGYPFRIAFLGIFDTVASVGIPMGANNTIASLEAAKGALHSALNYRSAHNGMLDLAFGLPGADPAPGYADGHMSWADDLRIPECVENCLHMIAGHEFRNSFPVDSVRVNGRYPGGCREMVFPGVHSDVGGGYRPGELARSETEGEMLSLVPLRVMHAEAVRFGVPLRLLAELETTSDQKDFAIDPDGSVAYARLGSVSEHYLSNVENGNAPIGEVFLSHKRLYFAWRFAELKKNLSDYGSKSPTPDDEKLAKDEPEWKKEQADLKQQLGDLDRKQSAANNQVNVLEQRRNQYMQDESDNPDQDIPTPYDGQIQDAQDHASEVQDQYLRVKGRLNTLPDMDGSVETHMEVYDRQLLKDAQILKSFADLKGRQNLRPHYRAMLEAYEAEFISNTGLRDEQIAAFFETYVHDSLAGFAVDATLPSDPRVIYIGGDEKLKYAANQPLSSPDQIAAA